MTPLDELMADPLAPQLDSQQAWTRAILETIEPFIDWMGERGGNAPAAREIVAWALVDAAAQLAVHGVEIYTPEYELDQAECDAAIANFANAARVALLGCVADVTRQ